MRAGPLQGICAPIVLRMTGKGRRSVAGGFRMMARQEA
jgi:hypothetical protein